VHFAGSLTYYASEINVIDFIHFSIYTGVVGILRVLHGVRCTLMPVLLLVLPVSVLIVRWVMIQVLGLRREVAIVL
jgi:hypothetical protein